MEKKIIFKDLELVVSDEENNKKIILQKKDIKTTDYNHLLFSENNNFLQSTLEVGENEVIFNYSYEKKYLFQECKDGSFLEKLRLSMNVFSIIKMDNSIYIPVLHPDNLVYDESLNVMVCYYGIENQLPPYYVPDNYLLKAYQSLIISLFTNYSFNDIFSSELMTLKTSSFLKKIIKCESCLEVKSEIEKVYLEEKNQERKNKVLVNEKRYGILKKAVICLGLLGLLAIIYLGVLLIFTIPFNNKMLESNEYFIDKNYNKVINLLEKEKPESLLKLNQYELAYSYLDGEVLSDEQKASITNNLNLKSDEMYLQFWIYNGRGDYEKSLDLGKSIGDNQLIMYALLKMEESIQNKPDISGSEKAEQLALIKGEIEKYEKELGVDEENKEQGE